MIVEAFSSMPDKQLIVIGDGPDFEKCKAVAGSNIQLMGWQPTAVLKDHMQRAKAFIFAAEEDFGITPLEAQACGTPVIAFGKGAVLETIRGLDHKIPTGVFFPSQEPEAVIEAVRIFESSISDISSEACRINALRFSPEIFRDKFHQFLDTEWIKFSCQNFPNDYFVK
jgi:glycosyltransferase involved in cell wall biosynthesis